MSSPLIRSGSNVIGKKQNLSPPSKLSPARSLPRLSPNANKIVYSNLNTTGNGIVGDGINDDNISVNSNSSLLVKPKISKTRAVMLEARDELTGMKSSLRRESSKILTRLDAIGAVNFIEGAKIGSLEQMRDDLRQDDMEAWFRRRNKEPKSMKMEDKRVLRKWFLNMDADGSGEVSMEELQVIFSNFTLHHLTQTQKHFTSIFFSLSSHLSHHPI